MRLPLGTNLQSRDGSVTRDAKMLNCVAEKNGDMIRARGRPGITDLGAIASGDAKGLFVHRYRSAGTTFNYIVGAYNNGATSIGLRGGTISGTFSTAFTVDINPTVPTSQIWTAANDDLDSMRVLIVVPDTGNAAVNQARYLSETTLSTPAISVTVGTPLVGGAAFLDGYYFIYDSNAVLWNSALNNIASWPALGFIRSSKGDGQAVAMVKSQAYIACFKDYSTELFFNNANPVGSPLSPVDNGFTQIGCAKADSIAQLEAQFFFVGQSRQRGRSVYMMEGLTQTPVSTPDIERIINESTLATVYAMAVNLDGHRLYILTMTDLNITVVYDVETGLWQQWSSLTEAASVSVTSITRSDNVATVVTSGAHGLSDGDPVRISGAAQTDYNGIFQISYISSTSFSYEVSGSPATPATGTILAYPYTETYFKFVKYANYNNRDMLYHETDGTLYEFDPSIYQDDGVPIKYLVRTQRLDGGIIEPKVNGRLTVVGDSADTSVMVRWSDDDMQTQVPYRPVDLSLVQPMLRRCGAFHRRTYEVCHVENGPIRLDALELEVAQ